MPEKSINPDDPNFDAGLATNFYALKDRDPDGAPMSEGAEDDDDADSEDPDEEDDELNEALEHYIPDDIQNDPTPREYRD